jgi:AcrR family transcriptional regulator
MGSTRGAPEPPGVNRGQSEALYGKLKPGPGLPASDVAAHQCARIQSAMVDIVAERGYGAVKVRELVLLAGVSSRAFYENFGSKEDCFLRTYDLVVRGTTRRIIASQAGERDWRERPRLIFAAFARELESEPAAARFALEARAAGPAALEQVRRAESTFEAMLGESFARAPDGIVVPPVVIEGMIAGVARVAGNRLLVGRESELPGLTDELADWGLCYPGKFAGQLVKLDLGSVWRNTMFEPLTIPAGSPESGTAVPTGDRAVILTAVAKLASANGYRNLTVPRIRSGAGVSRAKFDSHFSGVEECFVAALDQRAGEAIAQAARAQSAGRTASGGTYRAIAALCDQIAGDPVLAGLFLTNDFSSKSPGDRSRRRIMAAFADEFVESGPPDQAASTLGAEATAGATWGIFHRHMIRDWAQRREVAASISFMALAPTIGGQAAAAAIRSEQAA